MRRKINKWWYPTTLHTSILVGSNQVKIIDVPCLRSRPWKVLRNVDREELSIAVGLLILGVIRSSKAFQNVLPSTSLTSTMFSDFSKGAVHHTYIIRWYFSFHKYLNHLNQYLGTGKWTLKKPLEYQLLIFHSRNVSFL